MAKQIRLKENAIVFDNCKECPFHAIRSSLAYNTVEGYCELTGSLTDRKTYANQVLPSCRLEDYTIIE